jgi:phage terminase large subunit GpA-like protein
VSEWADEHRYLSQRASAEPGRWRTDRTPYLREIMDALSPSSPIERVVFQKGAQIGGTEAGNNWLGYIISRAPGPVMAVSPTVELAKRASRQRIDPLIEESPALRDLVQPARARDSGNTVLSKEFPGGVLVMTGANSAVGLRSMPVRYLFLDEVDAYPPDADGEGDPISLATKRTATFARRKILMVSTPTVTGLSRIEAAFAESDQRYYYVPCPECREPQVLKWAQVKWSEIGVGPEAAKYACAHCGSLLDNAAKAWMLPRGEWRATADGDGRTAGFHLSALYSPPGWFSWADAAQEFVQAGRNPNRLKVVVNTILGETFAESGEAPDWQRLYERREDYPLGTVPAGGLYLTVGADVQKDRLEVEIVAWGRRRESWSVDHRILFGDPAQPDVWAQLDRVLAETFPHVGGGRLSIGKLAIDTGGHHTQAVYEWTSRQAADRVLAVKGVHGTSVALGSPTLVDVNARGRRLARGGRLWPVGVSILKGQLYGWLAQDPPEPGEPAPEGYCHFPEYPPEYFKQLTAERLVRRRTKSGFVKLEWELTRERNEALDLRVYAMAAALAARLDRWSETDWLEAEEQLAADAAPARPTTIRSPWLAR